MFRYGSFKNIGYNNSETPAVYSYETTEDSIAQVSVSGYFSDPRAEIREGDLIIARCTDGSTTLTALNSDSVVAMPAAADVAEAVAAIPDDAVVFILGQSNARGSALNADIDPALDQTYSNVQIFGGTNFVDLSLTTNQSDSGKHGFEMSLAYELQQLGKSAKFIKYAIGGSVLDAVGSNYWLPFTNSLNRTAIQTWLNKGLGKLASVGAITIVWCQGEADSNPSNSGAAGRYEQNLLALFTQLTEIYDIKKIIIVKTNDAIVPATYTKTSTVRAAQDSVASIVPSCEALETTGLALQDDVLHYTASSYKTIGQQLTPLIEFVGKSSIKKSLFKTVSLVNFRDEAIGASSLVTGVTTTSNDVVAFTSLGQALAMTGTGTNGGRTIALCVVDNFDASSAEFNFELIPAGSGIGGAIVNGSDVGGVKTGFLVRFDAAAIKLFDCGVSTTTLIETKAITVNAEKSIAVRTSYDAGTLNVYLKNEGSDWEQVFSHDSTTHTGSELYLTAGWGATDPTKIGFGNIRRWFA